MSVQPVWVHGAARDERLKRKREARQLRRWRMEYDLIYDGGGSAFAVHYRTKLGARWSAFWHMHVRSWGGSAQLFDSAAPSEAPHG